MANLKGITELSAPNTKFTQVQARERPDVRSSQISTLVKGGAIAGKEFAKRSGAELAGGDLSQADVHEQADVAEFELDNQITDAMVAGGGTLTGNLQEQERTQIEIKDASLTEFAQNDRVLLELRDRGVISTIEARGRRQLNLKRALSNPINALFQGEFLNASKSMTGGAKGAVGEVFPFTPEELKSQAIQKEQVKATAEHEGKVAGIVAATGRPDSVIRTELASQADAEIQLKQIERTKQQRALNGEEFSREHGLHRNNAARGITLQINKLNAGNGGNGLDANSMVSTKQLIDQTYRGMLEAINSQSDGGSLVNIGQIEKDKELERLNAWRKGMNETLALYDGSTIDQAKIKQFENVADKGAWENTPMFMFLSKVNPKIFEIAMLEGGLNGNLDRFTFPGTAAGLQKTVSKLEAINKFSVGQPAETVDVAGIMMSAITNGGTTAGLEYVTSSEVQEDNAKRINLAKIYNDATEVVMEAYSTPDAQRLSVTSPEFRGEISKGMTAGLSKMNRIKDMIGAKDEVIFAEVEQQPQGQVFVGKGLGFQPSSIRKTPNWILNLPDGMQEYSQDLRAMHKAVQKQPWMWSHVKDNYVDGSDAFNGFMRGEWDVNVELLEPTPDEDGEQPAGKAPRVVTDGSTPLKPGAIQMAEAVSEAPQSFLSASSTARVGEDLEANKRAGEGTTGFPTVGDKFDLQGLKNAVNAPDSVQGNIIDNILKFEGGFQANISDKGNFDSQGNLIGTNLGITPSSYKVAFGKEPTRDELLAVTPEQAVEIYAENYWNPNKIGQMPPEVQEIAMNMFVMTSPKNAAKAIQRASGAKDDGVIGPQTIKAMRGVTPEEIWEEYRTYLESLKGWKKFGKGWTNRYEAILQKGGK